MTTNTPDNTQDEIKQLSPKVQERLQNLLQEEYVSEENGELVKEFILELGGNRDDQISDIRLKKYISQFNQILPHNDINLLEADIKGIIRILNGVDSEDISPTTMRDRRVALNKFYRTMFPEMERPNRIWRILNSDATDTTHPDKKDLKRHYDFILPDEVMKMSEAGKTKCRRDELLPLFFYLTGARLKEVQEVKIKHLTRGDSFYKISLLNQKNKNLPPRRNVYLTRLTHLMREWLEQHPRSDDPEAPLICIRQKAYNTKTGEEVKDIGEQMSKKSISKVLEGLAEKAEIDKPVNPHAFRYSMATYYSNFTDLDIKEIADKGGWGSLKQVRGYILDIGEIGDKRRKERQGIKTDLDSRFTVLDKQKCGNCGKVNGPTRDICTCGHALSDRIAREEDEKEVVMVEKTHKGLTEAGLL